jgi:hypothetical protein
MQAYTKAVNHILQHLGVEPKGIPCGQSNPRFSEYKQFAITDAIEHNDLSEDSPVVRQLSSANDIEHLESLLRQNLDYCDDCVIKLYRRYIINGS